MKTQVRASAKSGQSSLCAQCATNDSSFDHADSEDSDQTELMPTSIRSYAEKLDIKIENIRNLNSVKN